MLWRMSFRSLLPRLALVAALALVGWWLFADRDGTSVDPPGRGASSEPATPGTSGDRTPDPTARAGRVAKRADANGTVKGDSAIWIRGVVRSAAGKPLVDARVAAADGVALTRPDGTFAIEVAQADFAPDLGIDVRHESYLPQRRRLRPTSTIGLEFALEREVTIRGVVVDQDATPVPGVRLTLRRREGDVRHASADETGAFTFERATTGSWLLGVILPQPRERWRGPGELLITGSKARLTVTIVKLEPGTATLVASLRTGENEKPAEPRQVMLYRRDRASGPGQSPYMHEVIWRAGTARASKLRPGLWRLHVVTQDGRTARRDFAVNESTREVRFDLSIERQGAVRGRITLPAEHRPKILAVRLVDCPEARWVEPGTDPVAGGRGSIDPSRTTAFQFDRVPSNASLRLQVEGGGLWGEAEVTVNPGGEAQLVVPLSRAGRLHLRGSGPSPASTVVVSLKPAGRSEWLPEIVRGSLAGETTLLRRPVGAGPLSWRVRFRASPLGPIVAREGEVEISAGETRTVLVVFPDR